MGDPTLWICVLIAAHLAAIAAMAAPPIARHLQEPLHRAGHRTEQATGLLRYRLACARLYLTTTVRGSHR